MILSRSPPVDFAAPCFSSRVFYAFKVPAGCDVDLSEDSSRHFAGSGSKRRCRRRLELWRKAPAIAAVGVVGLAAPTLISPTSGRSFLSLPEKLRADGGDEPSYVLFRGRPISYGQTDAIRNKSTDFDTPQTQPANGENEEIQDQPKNAWDSVTSKLGTLKDGFADRIVDSIVPDWAKVLPGFITKLQNELSMAPGSLAEEVWQEAHDPEMNPEIIWDANVRVSSDLCEDERTFLRKRKEKVRAALAAYLDVTIEEIHPDDVPVIAMCGSGGGLRALVAGSSSYLSAKEAGLFDCLTYTAGVSGTCWLQALYYSSLTGQSHERLINHLKHRLGVHIAYPPAAFSLVNSAPTNKYLLGGLIEKMRGVPEADFGIVDVYGLLLAGRLFVPRGELNVSGHDLKLSNQRRFLWYGDHPLPIYTAVRHEIPEDEQVDGAVNDKRKANREAWFQWFEFTPYEFWCEELGAGIPTWSLGRNFDNGHTVWRSNGLTLPEVRIPLLLGIWGSAFCATLSHYYQEIRPLVKGLAGFHGIDAMMLERNEELVKVHMIDPAAIPNYIWGMDRGQLPDTVPESVFKQERLRLMDAGMSNNLPIYPLLRPGRDVDIIISFDVSADPKKDNWLRVVDGYARQRGIKGWPIGAGWPSEDASNEQIQKDLSEAHAESEEEAKEKFNEARNREQGASAADAKSSDEKDYSTNLTYCNVWVGSTRERSSSSEPPPSKLVSPDKGMELMEPDAGITVVYFPLLPNPKVKDINPQTSAFMSTWNFIYTPDQVDQVVNLATANFNEGAEQTKRTVRAVWERKKRLRVEKEEQLKAERQRISVQDGAAEGGLGDQFS